MLRIRMAGALVVLAGMLAAPAAQAYCVYNKTKQHIPVHGEFCTRCLKTMIAPGSKACCPGKEKGCRGNTYITVQTPNEAWETAAHYKHAPTQVTAHGWVEIYGAGKMFSGKVYNDSGKKIWEGALVEGKKID